MISPEAIAAALNTAYYSKARNRGGWDRELVSDLTAAIVAAIDRDTPSTVLMKLEEGHHADQHADDHHRAVAATEMRGLRKLPRAKAVRQKRSKRVLRVRDEGSGKR